jgi:hypothetical protein
MGTGSERASMFRHNAAAATCLPINKQAIDVRSHCRQDDRSFLFDSNGMLLLSGDVKFPAR